jgi:ribosomal protein S18 acetylase RimI-like enzyme
MHDFVVKPLASCDQAWVADFLEQHWGAAQIVTRGKVYLADRLPGFAAFQDERLVGLITYRIEALCNRLKVSKQRSLSQQPIAQVIGRFNSFFCKILSANHIECEIISLDSLVQGTGIGSALTDAVQQRAKAAGCQRLWLITTNDNLNALGFYQKRGFHLAALHRNALDVSRRLKPQIPLIGLDGIPLRDEIELEILLS